MRIIISGGGTGGHIYPAIAIADAVKRQRPAADILFVGAKGRMEMEKVPKAGYPIKGLWISGFQRKLSWQNLSFPLKVLWSLFKARQIVRQFRPAVVVGVGGYASGPTLRAANALGIPTLLQEQNSYAGVTNRLLAAKAAKICVAYAGMERFFPADRLLLSGNPVRQDLVDLAGKRGEAAAYFGTDPARPHLLILGGSLGARTLNQALAAAEALLAQRPDVQVIWQCGKLYHEAFRLSGTANLPQVQIRPFIERMDLAYALADVAIARAGALSVSELCVAGVPSIFVPSPNVAEDHQRKNAEALVAAGAAQMIADADAVAQMMGAALRLLDDLPTRQALAQRIKALAKPQAAADIAREVIALAEHR